MLDSLSKMGDSRPWAERSDIHPARLITLMIKGFAALQTIQWRKRCFTHCRTLHRQSTFFDGKSNHLPGVCHAPMHPLFNEKLRQVAKSFCFDKSL